MRLKTKYNVRIIFKCINLFDHFVKNFKTKNSEQIKYFRNLNEEQHQAQQQQQQQHRNNTLINTTTTSIQ